MYQEYYKFSAKPFQLTPDLAFFYESKGHSRVLAYLKYGVHQGDGFIVVTGGIGTGKTTLVKALLSDLEKQKEVLAVQLVSSQLSAENLLRSIATCYGIKCESISKAILLNELEKFFLKKAHENKRLLLIVDEAQNLPAESLEELRMLSNFHFKNRPLFQSFLVGQEQLRTMLQLEQLEQLRQRVIASYHLGPLSESDTKRYIEYRLNAVGWINDPLFTDEAYAAIYDSTEGVPRRINTFCDRILLYCALEELHEITPDTIRKVNEEMAEEIVTSGTYVAPHIFEPTPITTNTSNIMRRDNEIENLSDNIENLSASINNLNATIKQYFSKNSSLPKKRHQKNTLTLKKNQQK